MDYKTLSLIIIFVFSIIFVSIIIYAIFDNDTENRIGNELTITVEIMIGVFIAILIHNYSSKRQNEMDLTLEKIKTMTEKIEAIENIQYEKIKKENKKINEKRKKVYLEIEGKLFHFSCVDILLENWEEFNKFEPREIKAKIEYVKNLLNDAHGKYIGILKNNLDLLDNKHNETLIAISEQFDKLLKSATEGITNKEKWEELAKYLQVYSLSIPKQHLVFTEDLGMKNIIKYSLVDKRMSQ